MQIRLTQVVDELSDSDDQNDMPAGRDGNGSYFDYQVPIDIDNEDDALDWFHGEIPIGCLEDFVVDVVERKRGELHVYDNDMGMGICFVPEDGTKRVKQEFFRGGDTAPFGFLERCIECGKNFDVTAVVHKGEFPTYEEYERDWC